jgi:hypothetical protein
MPPIYPYECDQGHSWEVAKPLSAIDAEERCSLCGEVGGRQIALVAIDKTAASSWQPTWNPGLGQVVKSAGHAKRLAKEKGLIEVGTEKPETIHKHFDKQREDAYKARWADDRVKVYD